MRQALTVCSLTVEEKTPAQDTVLHVVVHRGDGRPFRLRNVHGAPLVLGDFGDRTLDAMKEIFSSGKFFSADVKSVPFERCMDADYRCTDMVIAQSRIVTPTPPEARKKLDPIPKQPDEVGYNAGDQSATRSVAAAQYRATG